MLVAGTYPQNSALPNGRWLENDINSTSSVDISRGAIETSFAIGKRYPSRSELQIPIYLSSHARKRQFYYGDKIDEISPIRKTNEPRRNIKLNRRGGNEVFERDV